MNLSHIGSDIEGFVRRSIEEFESNVAERLGDLVGEKIDTVAIADSVRDEIDVNDIAETVRDSIDTWNLASDVAERIDIEDFDGFDLLAGRVNDLADRVESIERGSGVGDLVSRVNTLVVDLSTAMKLNARNAERIADLESARLSARLRRAYDRVRASVRKTLGRKVDVTA